MERYLQRLSEIYKAIAAVYNEARRYYNFTCEGCNDNCCVTKFYHHTFIEEFFLSEGLKGLAEDKKRDIVSRAEDVVGIHTSSAEDIRSLCPLNEAGLCILYEHRPMICRIHGVPYELFRNFKMEYGDGCYRFITEKNNITKDFRINRTNFYLEIAMLEKEVREKLNFTGKYKKTTAEMVLSIVYGKSLED